jgi:hypothetical protein
LQGVHQREGWRLRDLPGAPQIDPALRVYSALACIRYGGCAHDLQTLLNGGSFMRISTSLLRPSLLALVACAGFLAVGTAAAQNAPVQPRTSTRPPPGEMRPISAFGTGLTDAQAVTLLREMRQATEQLLAASRAAEQASSVDQVKTVANQAVEAVWGIPTGIAPGTPAAAVRVPGWKERWQVSGSELPDSGWLKRNGTLPPTITDPRKLGIMGRGLAVRGKLESASRGSSLALLSQPTPADASLASLNNVIGWTYISYGRKGEWQPRPSLTHVWDAPAEFWNSSADTGWLEEVYSQGVNILKTDYAGDVALARRHAAGMTQILQRVLMGMDADRNGTVEAKPMEGGLVAALAAATRTTLRSR